MDPSGNGLYDSASTAFANAVSGIINSIARIRFIGPAIGAMAGVVTRFMWQGQQILFHVTSGQFAQNIVSRGIDIVRYGNPESRFGPGFYMAAEEAVAEAEAAAPGALLQIELNGARVLDLTSRWMANQAGYDGTRASGLRVAQWALQNGYDVIRFASTKVAGGVNWAIINPSRASEIVKEISEVTK